MISILFYFISACLASSAFGLVFDLRGKTLIYGAMGGGFGWVIYRLLDPLTGYALAFFVAAVFVSVYAEVMARLRKMPASVYILVGMLPLVPGEGIYLTMSTLVSGDYLGFSEVSRKTFGSAGILALAILLVSSVARLLAQVKEKRMSQ